MKERKSKLDQYAEQLWELDQDKRTLAWMQAWLKEEGCVTSASTLSEWLAAERQRRLEAQLFGQIASGGRMNKELDQAYEKNPAPEIDRLIQVTKTLIMSLQVKGAADPAMLGLANSMQSTVLDYLSGLTKAQFKERELKLKEDKFRSEFCERILDQALRETAERIANSSMSQAAKIAAMRKAAFQDVDALQASGEIKLPKSK